MSDRESQDGATESRSPVAVPGDQAWFWSEGWQRMEREADHDFETGRVLEADSLDQLLLALGE